MLSLYLPLVVRIQCYPILPRSIQQLKKIIKKVHSNAWLVTLFMLFWPAGVFEKMARFSFTRNKQRIIIKKQLWPIKWVGEGFFFGLRGGKSYEKNNWVLHWVNSFTYASPVPDFWRQTVLPRSSLSLYWQRVVFNSKFVSIGSRKPSLN